MPNHDHESVADNETQNGLTWLPIEPICSVGSMQWYLVETDGMNCPARKPFLCFYPLRELYSHLGVATGGLSVSRRRQL
jgi:hypothetical protein